MAYPVNQSASELSSYPISSSMAGIVGQLVSWWVAKRVEWLTNERQGLARHSRHARWQDSWALWSAWCANVGWGMCSSEMASRTKPCSAVSNKQQKQVCLPILLSRNIHTYIIMDSFIHSTVGQTSSSPIAHMEETACGPPRQCPAARLPVGPSGSQDAYWGRELGGWPCGRFVAVCPGCLRSFFLLSPIDSKRLWQAEADVGKEELHRPKLVPRWKSVSLGRYS